MVQGEWGGEEAELRRTRNWTTGGWDKDVSDTTHVIVPRFHDSGVSSSMIWCSKPHGVSLRRLSRTFLV